MNAQMSLLKEMLPPFIAIEAVEENTPEYEALPMYKVIFNTEDGKVKFLPTDILEEYTDRFMNMQMARSIEKIHRAHSNSGVSNAKSMDVSLIKELASQIVQGMDPDYIRGSTVLYLIHPQYLKGEVTKALAKLPFSPTPGANEQRLISIRDNERTHAFQVEPYQMELPRRNFESPGWLIALLFNPEDPALVLSVPASGPMNGLNSELGLGDTDSVEFRSMNLIEQELGTRGMNVNYVHEPNGHTSFPDFNADIDGIEWEIEVTRVLGRITKDRVINEEDRDRASNIAKAVRKPPIDRAAIDAALDKAIDEKRGKLKYCKAGAKYCLVLVNSIDLDIGSASTDWSSKDLKAFDTVILVQVNPQPTLEYIKGNLP